MKHLFWLEPGRLAGRPGPDLHPWDLRELKAAGMGAILSVNDANEVFPHAVRAAGLEYAHIPFSDQAPPRPGDAEICAAALPRTRAFIADQHAAGRAVLVHCLSGKDRTGLTLAYHLMGRDGLDPETALAEVRKVRPIALNAIGWEAMGLAVLRRLATTGRDENSLGRRAVLA
jgi:protein-tyrosine phosphatase